MQQTALVFVVFTQVRENYGAHNWDGVGACPQYWKFKGGHDYIVEGCKTAEEAEAYVATLLPAGDHYYEEYVTGAMDHAKWKAELEGSSEEYVKLVTSAARCVWKDA
jgi:hypothetical protein